MVGRKGRGEGMRKEGVRREDREGRGEERE